MIGSLMYLTASRLDITFAVCACARDSPFDLEAFLDSDYAGASLDRKSTTGGCQFLRKRLISWKCKKQTIVLNSITEAGYVAAANCYGQMVLMDVFGLKMLFGLVLRVKHGKKIVSAARLALCCWAKDTKPYIKLRSSRYVHWDQKVVLELMLLLKIEESRLIVVGEGSEQPPEPQPIPSTAPPEVLSQVTTAAASQPPKDPNTYRRTKRGRNTKVPQSGGSPNKVGDETINEEMLDSMERATTTAFSLEAEQASGTINKTQFTTTLNEPFSLELGSGGHTLGSGEDIMEHQIELMDIVPNTPHDSPLLGVNIPGSDEGSLALNELMDMVTKLS
ncbi:hypothetical protein Tco_1413123, partial [Tanacetum coccineum]